MNDLWITEDWHLYSKENNAHHPFKTEKEIDNMINVFKSNIQANDVMIHLGDVSDPEVTDFNKLSNRIKSIPGIKILCKGNHDTESDQYYYNLGFDEVTDIATLYNIIFSHKPVKTEIDQINIHGHLHDEKISDMPENHINPYSIDTKYKLIKLNDLLKHASDVNLNNDNEIKSYDTFDHKFHETYHNIINIENLIDKNFNESVLMSDSLSEILFSDIDQTKYFESDDSKYQKEVDKLEYGPVNEIKESTIYKRALKPYNAYINKLEDIKDHHTIISEDTDVDTSDADYLSEPDIEHTVFGDRIKYFKDVNGYEDANTPYSETTIANKLIPGFKSNAHIKLTKFKKIYIDKEFIDNNKADYPSLKHIIIDPDVITTGWLDHNKLAAFLSIKNTENSKFITAMEILPEYKSKSLGSQVLLYAIQKMSANELSVNKKNELAIKLYKDNGFKSYKSTDNTVYMKRSTIHETYQFESCDDLSDLNEASTDIYNQFINEHHIKNINDLSKWMKTNISYAEYKTLKSFEDVLSTKSGSCHDQVVFEYYILKKLSISPKILFFIAYKEGESVGGMTHSLIYWKEQSGDIYWFENSWDDAKGIHKYKSFDEMKDDIIKRYNRMSESNHFPELEFKGTNIQRYKHEITLKTLVTSILDDKSTNGNITETIDENTIKLYHLSQKNLEGKIISPRIPNNYFTQNGFENNTVPRVCFTKTIDQSLMALNQKDIGMELYVHVPYQSDTKYNIKTPSIKEVPDSKITGETWILNDVKMHCIGKIKVIGDANEPGLSFKYGNNISHLYKWNWKWIEKYNKNITETAIKWTNDKKKIDNIEFNLKLWKPNTGNNILYVTGLTGSGKSTFSDNLSIQYSAKHIYLDHFSKVLYANKNYFQDEIKTTDWEDVDIIKKYFHHHQKAYLKNPYIAWKDKVAAYKNIINWLQTECQSSSNKSNLFIVEGIQIYAFINPDYFVDKPIIIIDTPPIKSAIQRILRTYNGAINEKETVLNAIKYAFSDLKEALELDFGDYKGLNTFIKNIDTFKESAIKFVNDKGEPVPKICPKCGSKVGVAIHGEPVFICTNKECKKFFGTVPFNETSHSDTKLYPVYVIIMHTGTTLASTIKTITHSTYSHVAISFDSSMTHMYSFCRGADANPFIGTCVSDNIHANFFKKRTIPYALYVIPSTKDEIKLMKTRLNFFIENRTKFKYNFTGLFKNYLGIVDNQEYKWFCSRFVADILNAGNPQQKYIEEPSLIQPDDFQDTDFATYVTGGLLNQYSSKKVDKITNKILQTEELKKIKLNETMELINFPYINKFSSDILNYQLSTLSPESFDKLIEKYKSTEFCPLDPKQTYHLIVNIYHLLYAKINDDIQSTDIDSAKDDICKLNFIAESIGKSLDYFNDSDITNIYNLIMTSITNFNTKIMQYDNTFNFVEYYNNMKSHFTKTIKSTSIGNITSIEL